jgi:hypothetical protein
LQKYHSHSKLILHCCRKNGHTLASNHQPSSPPTQSPGRQFTAGAFGRLSWAPENSSASIISGPRRSGRQLCERLTSSMSRLEFTPGFEFGVKRALRREMPSTIVPRAGGGAAGSAQRSIVWHRGEGRGRCQLEAAVRSASTCERRCRLTRDSGARGHDRGSACGHNRESGEFASVVSA